MKEFNVTAIIWQEDDVYVSKCSELEVASVGDTPQEALENLKEAVELYLENAKALGILNDFAASLQSPSKFTSTIGVTVGVNFLLFHLRYFEKGFLKQGLIMRLLKVKAAIPHWSEQDVTVKNSLS